MIVDSKVMVGTVIDLLSDEVAPECVGRVDRLMEKYTYRYPLPADLEPLLDQLKKQQPKHSRVMCYFLVFGTVCFSLPSL